MGPLVGVYAVWSRLEGVGLHARGTVPQPFWLFSTEEACAYQGSPTVVGESLDQRGQRLLGKACILQGGAVHLHLHSTSFSSFSSFTFSFVMRIRGYFDCMLGVSGVSRGCGIWGSADISRVTFQ